MRMERDLLETETECSQEQSEPIDNLMSYMQSMQKLHQRTRDERRSIRRLITSDARQETILDLFREEIRRAKPSQKQPIRNPGKTVLLAMLSDIHYGMTYDNRAGTYSAEIARERVMKYASEIVRIGIQTRARTCYVA